MSEVAHQRSDGKTARAGTREERDVSKRRDFIRVALGTFALRAMAIPRDSEIAAGPDTFLRVFPGSTPGSISIGVRTRVSADKALMTAFYRVPFEGADGGLLLSHERVGPVGGFLGYGVAGDFPLTAEQVEFIRVEFLISAGTRETARP